MTTQPEALRLADLLEEAPAYTLEDGTITLYLGGTVVADKVAAELRRLHAENRVLTDALFQAQEAAKALLAQRDALLEALRQIVGQHGQWNNGMWAANIARAAIKAVKENT